MKVHYPKLYNMAHLLALNVLLLSKDLIIIFIYRLLFIEVRSVVYDTQAMFVPTFETCH